MFKSSEYSWGDYQHAIDEANEAKAEWYKAENGLINADPKEMKRKYDEAEMWVRGIWSVLGPKMEHFNLRENILKRKEKERQEKAEEEFNIKFPEFKKQQELDHIKNQIIFDAMDQYVEGPEDLFRYYDNELLESFVDDPKFINAGINNALKVYLGLMEVSDPNEAEYAHSERDWEDRH